jgi:hypothetical protein
MDQQVKLDSPPVRDANFHTAEYELLYAEICENFRLAFTVAVYALIANGFIIAWVAQSAKDMVSPMIVLIAALIPILLMAFAFALYRFLLWRSSVIYQYLFTIEAQLANNGLGWEHFYRQISVKGQAAPASRLIFYGLFFIQFALGCAFAFVIFRKFL